MKYVLIAVLGFYSISSILNLIIGTIRLLYRQRGIGWPGRPTWNYFTDALTSFISVIVVCWLYRETYVEELGAIALLGLTFVPQAVYMFWLVANKKKIATGSV
jgi:hypothetical protein